MNMKYHGLTIKFKLFQNCMTCTVQTTANMLYLMTEYLLLNNMKLVVIYRTYSILHRLILFMIHICKINKKLKSNLTIQRQKHTKIITVV